MTNHKYFASVTEKDEPVDEEAVEMLLSRVQDDVQNGLFDANYGTYIRLYREMKKWLTSEKP